MPPHIAEVDHIICCAPKDVRAVLIKFYGQSGTFIDKAISFGLDKLSMRRAIDRAEYHVNSVLDTVPEKNIDSRQNVVSRQKPLTPNNPFVPLRSPVTWQRVKIARL